MLGTKIRSLILVLFVLVSVIPLSISAQPQLWWDEQWSSRQEIVIPFDTSTAQAHYQPIDMPIVFDEPCWAPSEDEHSIRVVMQQGDDALELESQLYDLDSIDESYITGCNLVFLIPEEADGDEQYFLYYNDGQTPSPGYTDHVDVEESYYRYEPISGYPLTSNYYKITQDDYVIYAISQEGELMGYNTAQHVTKMKPQTTEVMPKNGELFASFHFEYFYDQGLFDYSATSQKLLSKEILVDGNLMIEVGLVTTSKCDNMKTTALYKYYYCPSDTTRIHAHVVHEALDELQVTNNINTDGTYAVMQCGGITSSSIKDLNFGEILPYIHVSNEYNGIDEYMLDQDPDYIADDPDIPILATEDDVDAGTNTWASFDYGESGTAHAFIFNTNQVVTSGTDERDGIQVKAYEMDYPHLPGIENNMATMLFGRNSYEAGDAHDLLIPDDFIVEFDAEFFSTTTGGYELVPLETEIFQHLVDLKPSYTNEFEEETPEPEGYSLTVFAHHATSFPLGSAFSALTGWNLSYMSAELYRDDQFVVSGAMGRLLLKPLPDMSETSFIEKMVTILSSFDYRNATFVKKCTFHDLAPGRYVVKIYKENKGLSDQKLFVGYQIVDLSQDTKTRIWCRPQGSLQVSVVDQYGVGVEQAQIVIAKDETIISQTDTDNLGMARLTLPCHLGTTYTLKVYYKGFCVSEESFRMSYLRSIIPLKRSFTMSRYDYTVHIQDTWGLAPAVTINSQLSSTEMAESNVIAVEHQDNAMISYDNLLPAVYQHTLQYKSFVVEDDVTIPSENRHIVFPAEFTIHLNILDARGLLVEDARVILSRGGKSVEGETKGSDMMFSVPPGVYTVEVYDDDTLIGSRRLSVFSERSFDLITSTEPLFSILILCAACVVAGIGAVLSFIRKDWMIVVKLAIVALLIVAIVSPWWILSGSSQEVETTTTLYLSPLELITSTTADDVIAGEQAYLPDLFITVMSLIPILLVCAGILAGSSILLQQRGKRWHFLSLIGVLVLIGCCLAIFSVGMNELAEVGIGGLLGKGMLPVDIPGEDASIDVMCHWGPSIGFYLTLIAVLILLGILVLVGRKKA